MALDPGVWKAWRSPLFMTGLLLLAVAVACALFLVYVSRYGWRGDPNPNPVGIGVLLWLTAPPGFVMTILGLVRAIDRDRSERRQRGAP